MHTESVWDFSHDLTGIDIQDFDLGSVRNVEPAVALIDSKVVPTTLARDGNFLDHAILSLGLSGER